MKRDINIENFLSSTRITTRKELVEQTGLDDREVRNKISKLKLGRVVLSNSSRSGYRLAREYKSMSRVERDEELKQVRHSLNDKTSRINALKKQKRKEIAYIKMAEKIEQQELEAANYKHIPRID